MGGEDFGLLMSVEPRLCCYICWFCSLESRLSKARL